MRFALFHQISFCIILYQSHQFSFFAFAIFFILFLFSLATEHVLDQLTCLKEVKNNWLQSQGHSSSTNVFFSVVNQTVDDWIDKAEIMFSNQQMSEVSLNAQVEPSQLTCFKEVKNDWLSNQKFKSESEAFLISASLFDSLIDQAYNKNIDAQNVSSSSVNNSIPLVFDSKLLIKIIEKGQAILKISQNIVWDNNYYKHGSHHHVS